MSLLDLETQIVDDAQIDALYKHGSITRESVFRHPQAVDDGGFVLLRAGTDLKHSGLGVLIGDKCMRVLEKGLDFQGIKPRDARQTCALWGMNNLPLTVLLGGAGTGKTTLAVAYALNALLKEGKTVVLCKPTRLVGGPSDAWGTLPGGAEEKLQPYMESFLLAMRKVLGDGTQMFVDSWVNKGQLIVQPLETIRGMNFENAVLILDEAQNCSLHELMSVVSRVAENSKMIVLGDPAQIDVDCKWRETGLAQFLLSDSFYRSAIAKGIRLEAQYRGPLAALAACVLQEHSGELDMESDD